MGWVLQPKMRNSSPYYENIEFTLNTGQSDYDLDSNQATFLAIFNQDATVGIGRYPTYVSIRTDQTISFKVNSTSNHSITVASTDSPFVIDGVEIRNLYLSNSSGTNAAVKIFLAFSPTGSGY